MKSSKTIRLLPLLLWSIFSVFLLSNKAFAQRQKVSGTIINQRTSAPVSGATVSIKNTVRSAITDEAGRFSIDASPGEVLVISSVGYSLQEAKVGSGEVRVQLQESNDQMENVVVIGYGVQKKKLVTGANLQVKGDDLQKQSQTNALQGLQGQAPGVQITTSSGQPGSGINVIIRGKGTNGDASPLYIVDGVYSTDITYLNPADIESIDILKDAASAAIYGSQAANGVVIITTRTGRANQKPQITFDAYYGLQNVARKAQLLNAQEYATIMNEAAINSGKSPYFTNDQIANLPVNTNWLDQMFVKNAPTQNYVLGVTGGNANSVYSTSLSYTGQAGIVGGKSLSNYDRYTFRINSEHNLYKNIVKFGQHLTFNYQKNNGIAVGGLYNNTLRAAFGTSPFVPMYDSLGNFYDNSNSSWNPGESNPYAEMYYNNQNNYNSQKVVGDVYVQIEPLKGLRFRTTLSLNYGANEGRSYSPVYKLSIYSFNTNTYTSQSFGNDKRLQLDNLLSYSFKLNGGHNFEVMAGTFALKRNTASIYGRNRDLSLTGLQYAWLSNATNRDGTLITLNGSPYYENLASYFGRLQYNFKEKYLFNATIRADGSSKFPPGNRWGYFPSVSAGWIASREDFLSGVSWLNFFKLRGSWGQVGNQNIISSQYQALVSFSNANYTFGSTEGVLTPGVYPSQLSNYNLKWETSEQTNVGFDATVLKRLNINFDFYIKNTKDWLIKVPILATAGANPPYINGGNVKNKGVELALSYRNSIGKLNYSVGVNGAYNKNRIGNIPTQGGIIPGNTNVLYSNADQFYRAQNGFPVGYFWGLKTNGIFQTEAEVNSYKSKAGALIQPNAQPGDLRYVDLNGDGVIDNNDRTIIGDPNPDLTFGFTIAADYKGFDLSVLASGVAGNQLVQSWRNQSGPKGNYSAEILDRWTGPSSSNRIPRVTEDNRNWTQFSDLYIYDGSYLRINNITLGYDFSQLVKKNYLSKVRMYVAVLNAFTFTKYNGMDPEVGYNEGFSSGVDLGYYPRPRTVMIGANFRF